MVIEKRFPHLLGGVSALGPNRLRELAARANVAVGTSDDERRIATSLLATVERPDDLRRYDLTDADVETIGVALGLGARAAWRPSVSLEEFDRLPFYAKPSYDLDVWNALGATPSEPAAKAKPAPTQPKPPAKAKAKAKVKAKTKTKAKRAAPKAKPKAKSPAKRKAKPAAKRKKPR